MCSIQMLPGLQAVSPHLRAWVNILQVVYDGEAVKVESVAHPQPEDHEIRGEPV